MKLVDGRTGARVEAGSVMRSIERGDLVRVESIAGAPNDLGEFAVRLVPLGEGFTAFAGYDEEAGGIVLDGYWLS